MMKNKLLFVPIFFFLSLSVFAENSGGMEPYKTEVIIDNKNVKGTVTDVLGNPIAGVAVVLEGTTIGVITDAKGFYCLSVQKGGKIKIKFSFLGMQPQTIQYNGQEILDIVMQEDYINLNDVVVVGYGTQQKKRLTKSVSSIEKQEIERLAPTSISVQDLLGGGLAKGVLSIQNSGEPGVAPTINVRGTTSPYPNWTTGTMANSPLYVIDGVPMFVESTSINPLLNLSPNDIESIDILKDAAATAIYGSRGANGVIMIKTKDGKKDEEPTVTVGYTFTIGNPIKKNKVLNNTEFKTLHGDMLRNGVTAFNEGFISEAYPLTFFGNLEKVNINPSTGGSQLKYIGLREDAYGDENIDWEKEIQNRNAASHQYNVSIRGGSSHTVYSLSLHGMNHEGLYQNDKMDVYGGRLSLSTEINKYLKVGVVVNYSETKRDCSITDEIPWSTKPLAVRPDLPIYTDDGEYRRNDEIGMFGGSGLYSPNPVAMLEQKNSHENNQFLTNLFAEISILKGLKFRTDFSLTNYKFNSSYFSPITTQIDQSVMGMPPVSSLKTTNSKYKTITLNFQLNYQWVLNKHLLDALVGYGTERNNNQVTTLEFEGFSNDEILNNVGSAQWCKSQTELINKNGLNSWFARVNYGFDTRYLAEVSFRADASSRFGPDNQWGYFPAFSAGWIISRESFMNRVSWIDNLKLRASIGQTGSTNIDDFSYSQYFKSQGQYGESSSIVLDDLLPNQRIRWEKTTEYNVGADFSFFNNRIYGNIDWYTRKTDGALAPAPHILESGMSSFFDNIIDLSNRGYEISLGSYIIRNRYFTWNTLLNVSSNKSKIEQLNNAQINEWMQEAFQVGQPTGTVKGYVVDHIVQEQSEIDKLNNIAREKYQKEYQSQISVGDYLYKDIDNNGIIDENDRVVIANPEPSFFGGWSNQFTYKNFSLSFLMQFSQGGEAVYSQLQEDAGAILGHSVSREMYGNYWTPEHPDAKYARLAAFLFNSNSELNDRYVFSTSYLRMKNITLSYHLSSDLLAKNHIEEATVFITATNLFTITNWPGSDPETTGSGTLNMGKNNDPYPLSKTFSLGINLQF